MGKSEFSVLVVGAGGVGGITAALLKKSGYDVLVAVRNKEHVKLISEKGLNIYGVCGTHKVDIQAVSSASGIIQKKDLIILATKANEMVSAALSWMPCLKEQGYLMSLQNGICEDELASAAGKERVIGCVTGWGATMESHEKLVMTSKGDFIIGYPDRQPDEFLNRTANVLSAVVPVRVTGNIFGHKYSKLIINSCITSLGAICGLYLGSMLSGRKIRRIFIEIIREAVAVSEKMNKSIEVFAGRIDFKEFVKKAGVLSDFRRHLMIRVIGLKYRRLKSSSLQSLERAQKTEINYLNGYIVKVGEQLGVEVPVNKEIVRLIHEIEAGNRKITPANFDEPFFDRFN